MPSLIINDRPIGKGNLPYIIAEMSGNHNQSFEQATAIVDAAKRVGASAIKLQTYTADTITIPSSNPDFFISNSESLWQGETLYDLYKRAYTDWDWISEIMKYAHNIGIDCFSSVFDESSVDFMEDLNACAYKIASFENGHLPLIRKAASTKKPLIISTGMATEDEVDEAAQTARDAGCEQLVLLKCTSDYPADPKDANLLTLPYMADKYKCVVGLSDHTLGVGTAIASVALGASVIEKHFTTSREMEGVDSAFSADEAEMALLVTEANVASVALGQVSLNATQNEEKSRQFRRSIYATQPIKKGEVFSEANIRIIRPGYGLHPRHYETLLGRTANQAYEAGTRIGPSALSDPA